MSSARYPRGSAPPPRCRTNLVPAASRGARGRTNLVLALLTALLTVGGCAGETATDRTPAMGTPSAPPSTAAAQSSGASATPSGTDVAWLQLLIAMNERLLGVLELAPARTADPAVVALAGDARAARTAELALMHDIADGALLPTTNPHEGHDMPGMVTREELAALSRARGSEFDRLFTAALTAHLDQAARLCAAEQRSGADPAIRRLAARVAAAVVAEKARTRQIVLIGGLDIEARR
jgi:uncharacterized protein (DUF305 family)